MNTNFYYLRKKYNLSQKELAGDVGVTQMAISYYERGKRNPNLKTLSAIAEYFGVTVGQLIGTEPITKN